jgi:hypothetical protein
VNWLESIGEVGSWFFSCVVSRVRKVEKLLDSCAMALLLPEAAVVLLLVPVTGVVMAVRP